MTRTLCALLVSKSDYFLRRQDPTGYRGISVDFHGMIMREALLARSVGDSKDINVSNLAGKLECLPIVANAELIDLLVEPNIHRPHGIEAPDDP